MMGKEKPVWRVAFFSRLEERKGIKLFVDAISALNVSAIPNFEVRTPFALWCCSVPGHARSLQPGSCGETSSLAS